MKRSEFKKVYCDKCAAFCQSPCAPYLECDGDYNKTVNTMVNTIINLKHDMGEAPFEVVSIKVGSDTYIHLDSPGVVEDIADELGVNVTTHEDYVECYFANVRIIGFFW